MAFKDKKWRCNWVHSDENQKGRSVSGTHCFPRAMRFYPYACSSPLFPPSSFLHQFRCCDSVQRNNRKKLWPRGKGTTPSKDNSHCPQILTSLRKFSFHQKRAVCSKTRMTQFLCSGCLLNFLWHANHDFERWSATAYKMFLFLYLLSSYQRFRNWR